MAVRTDSKSRTVAPRRGSGWQGCYESPVYVVSDPEVIYDYQYVRSERGRRVPGVEHSFKRQRFRYGGYWDLHGCWTSQGGRRWDGTAWFLRHVEQAQINFANTLYAENVVSTECSSIRAYAIQKAFAQAREPVINLTATFVEFKETLEYIVLLYQRCVKLIVLYKSGTMREELPKILKEALLDGATEKAWLEYRYALLPLVLELQSYISWLMGASKGGKPFVERASTSERKDIHRRFTYGYDDISFDVVQRGTQTIKGSCVLSIVGLRDPAPLGTGIMDALAGAWEKFPLSFVIDWFIDIGQWLASFRDVELKFDKRSATFVYNLEVNTSVQSVKGLRYVQVPTVVNPMTFNFCTIERIVGVDVEPPWGPLVVPGELSLVHLIDAISLSLGALRTAYPKRSK